MLLGRTSECRHGRASGYGCRGMDRAKRTLSAFGPGKGNRAATASEKAENVKVDPEVLAPEWWSSGCSADSTGDFSAEMRTVRRRSDFRSAGGKPFDIQHLY